MFQRITGSTVFDKQLTKRTRVYSIITDKYLLNVTDLTDVIMKNAFTVMP